MLEAARERGSGGRSHVLDLDGWVGGPKQSPRLIFGLRLQDALDNVLVFSLPEERHGVQVPADGVDHALVEGVLDDRLWMGGIYRDMGLVFSPSGTSVSHLTCLNAEQFDILEVDDQQLLSLRLGVLDPLDSIVHGKADAFLFGKIDYHAVAHDWKWRERGGGGREGRIQLLTMLEFITTINNNKTKTKSRCNSYKNFAKIWFVKLFREYDLFLCNESFLGLSYPE